MEAVKSFDKVAQIITDEEAANIPRQAKIKYEALSNKGLALVQLQNYEDAVKVFDKAISIKSDIFSLWINKGLALVPLKNIQRH